MPAASAENKCHTFPLYYLEDFCLWHYWICSLFLFAKCLDCWCIHLQFPHWIPPSATTLLHPVRNCQTFLTSTATINTATSESTTLRQLCIITSTGLNSHKVYTLLPLLQPILPKLLPKDLRKLLSQIFLEMWMKLKSRFVNDFFLLSFFLLSNFHYL